MSLSCDRCQATSTIEDAFAVETSALGRKRRYCPRCWQALVEKRARDARSALIVLGLALALVALVALALGGASYGTAAAWLTFNLFALFLLMEVAVLPHELGHALVAHALGYRAFSVTVGAGPRLFEGTVRSVRVYLHAYPFGGATVALPRDRRFFRLKQFLVVAAGPAFNGLVAACALRAIGGFDIGAIIEKPLIAPALVCANAVALGISLLPLKHPTPAGLHQSDGLALLKLPFMKSSEVTELLVARYVLEADSCRQRESLQEARVWAERGLDEFPNAPLLHFSLGFTLVLLGDCESARREFVAAAKAKDVAPALRALALNNVAWVDAVTAPNDRLEEADRLSQEAVRLLGFHPVLKATRGTVLVALGRHEEGIELLEGALREARDDELHPMARASYSGALALAAVEQGRLAEAEALLPAARGYHGRSPLLGRVEAAIAEASFTAGRPPRRGP